jgi:glycosyltransferase involved in cell wall biosynthesis
LNSAPKYKLLVICPYPVGVAPSQRLKYEQYFDAFREEGFEINVQPFASKKLWSIIYKKGNFIGKLLQTLLGYWRRFWLIFSLKKYDVVYIHLWVTPFLMPFYEWIYCSLAKKVVYDIDDLVYLSDNKSKANKTVGIFKSKKKPIYLMKHADHVITCTPYLDEFVRKFNAHTTDISSTVDTHKYIPVNRYENKNPIVLGWSGSTTTSKYFYLLKEVLLELSKKYPIKIIIMGNPNIQIDGLNIESLAWSESIELEVLQKFDIGLYPLHDEVWVLGKSGLKAIQYMALGVPTVATAIGANYRVIDDKVSGMLVNSHQELVDALSALIESPELRKKIGEAGRKKIEQEFSIETNQKNYLNVLKKMVS